MGNAHFEHGVGMALIRRHPIPIGCLVMTLIQRQTGLMKKSEIVHGRDIPAAGSAPIMDQRLLVVSALVQCPAELKLKSERIRALRQGRAASADTALGPDFLECDAIGHAARVVNVGGQAIALVHRCDRR